MYMMFKNYQLKIPRKRLYTKGSAGLEFKLTLSTNQKTQGDRVFLSSHFL